MHSTHCLNCDTELQGKFCYSCGQKADTHRITAKHFIMHDLVHGVWHFDRGMLYTLKSLFIRPGFMAREYIEGKRVQYYNVFYLILLIFPLIFLAQSLMGKHNDHALGYKASLLTFIPIIAGLSFVIFRRLNYNYFEHIFVAGVIVFWNLISSILISLEPPAYTYTLAYVLLVFNALLSFGMPLVIYCQLAKHKYKLPGIIWRALFLTALSFYVQMVFVQSISWLMRYFNLI